MPFLEISKEGDGFVFEIGNEVTNDVAEAVSILMNRVKWDDSIWDMEVTGDLVENVVPENSLFWLSGGNKEWNDLHYYNKPWKECCLEFQEEFGFMIMSIVKKSKKLIDIRNGFMRYLNLPILYDFAVSRDMVR
jgi:hypothetical protein